MSEHGGDTDSTAQIPRSRLYDYVDLARAEQPEPTGPEASERTTSPDPSAPSTGATDAVARRRREFAVLLGGFRRAAVLVPLDAENGAPLTADFGGIRWIYAFSHEHALARFALARGEGDREWAYQR